MKPDTDKPKDSALSKYGKKRAAGNQMYGPGCCAHKLNPSLIERAKERARESGHFNGFVPPRETAQEAA